jgi:acetyl-CoA carboxylase biotin carboxyl carrier protein
MDLRKIKKLIELVEESGIAELEVKSGDEAIRIARPIIGVGASVGAGVATVAISTPAAATDPNGTSASASSNTSSAQQPSPTTPSVEVRAPMAGTFYAASEPGAPSFCSPGTQVAIGDVVCIIESMKMMNEIRSEQSGAVVELLVANAEPVSSGQVLMRIG